MLLCIWWDAPLSLGWVECRDIVLKLPNKHTYTLKHIHTHSQRLSALSPGDAFPFLDQEQEHFPPLLPLLYECRKAPPLLEKNKTTKQSPSCTSPSHAHIHTLQANIPSFAQRYTIHKHYETPSGVLRACTPTQSVALPASPWRKLEFASVREKAGRGEAGRKRGLGCTFHEMLHQKQARKYCFTMLVYVRNCSFWKSLRKIRRRRSLWIVF